jgi:hypothetical protein
MNRLSLRVLLAAFLLAGLPMRQAGAAGLPPSRLVSSFAYDEMLARLQQEPLLASIGKEQYGSPVLLRVTHSIEPTAAGAAAGFTSAILAGGSLGLLPVVENKDLVITYDLFVNETLICTYEYRHNFTRAFNIYSKDKTGGLGGDGEAWALETVRQFVTDLNTNPKIPALIAEYRLYFPEEQAAKPVQ